MTIVPCLITRNGNIDIWVFPTRGNGNWRGILKPATTGYYPQKKGYLRTSSLDYWPNDHQKWQCKGYPFNGMHRQSQVSSPQDSPSLGYSNHLMASIQRVGFDLGRCIKEGRYASQFRYETRYNHGVLGYFMSIDRVSGHRSRIDRCKDYGHSLNKRIEA